MTKFQIGDVVYQANAGPKSTWVICPECLGSGRLRVILGDDSEVSIACVCCENGYHGSLGKLSTYQFLAEVDTITITGVDAQTRNGQLQVRYSFGSRSIEDSDVFATLPEAAARAEQLVKEHEAKETKRLSYKEKKHKSWAWNVSYWRGQIRDAKQTIAGAEARLAVVPKNSKQIDKEEKPCPNSQS